MTELFILGQVNQLINTPEFTKDFLSKFKDYRFDIKPRFGTCDEPEFIEIKIKSITHTENGVILEFATQDDVDRFYQFKDLIPIKMTFLPPE